MSKRDTLLAIRAGHNVTYRCDYVLADPDKDPTTCLDVELAFTEAHKGSLNESPYIREAKCLAVEYPALFRPIEDGDIFPGWLEYDAVGIGLENNCGGVAYYCREDLIDDMLKRVDFSDEKRRRIIGMKEYWAEHATITASIKDKKDYEEGRLKNPPRAIEPTCPMGQGLSKYGLLENEPALGEQWARLSGVNVDFDKLLRLGVPGMVKEIKEKMALADEDKLGFYKGLLMSFETLEKTLLRFSENAKAQLRDLPAGEAKKASDLLLFSQMFENLAHGKPDSFRSAMELFWIYQWMSRVVNFSRMDVFLGDFLAHDLDSGVLTEQEAQALIDEMWKLIADKRIDMNSRVIIGGKGRRNPENADRFALLAIQASGNVRETEPQLTLRFYKGQNPKLMEKALDVIGEGCVYPMLFNDDVNIPAITKAFRCSEEDALQYLPYGCGEYGLEHMTMGSPNGSFHVHTLVEAMIFNGKTTSGSPASIPIEKRFEDYESFDEFYKDFASYMKKYSLPQAKRQRVEHEVESSDLGFLYCSALYDDCVSRGLPMSGGGARYLGGVVETFGLVNAADSMAVVKKFVFDEKAVKPEELREMLVKDFEGYEDWRRLFADYPKFGNDIDAVDEILARMSDDVCEAYNMHALDCGMDYFLACNVNNRAHVEIGRTTPATAEGRHAGKPLANGNTPTAGNDKSGVTAFLKSATKVKHDNNAGYTHNMKFSKSMFKNERPKVAALLQTFFELGGPSAMITCVGKDDLQKAKANPEAYKSLMVRVGGFCARFVELEGDIQDDIINRTLY
ncbi:MAG: hypothetical protein LBT59_07920 [Clostridiales bacterium]|jgi:pyruvate-formate lyase|nr:hypothetical protein [Clostridiales bacterium]